MKKSKNFTLYIIGKVIKENKLLCAALVLSIVGVVLVSLIPPQLLKIVIDNNLIPMKKDGLMLMAFFYLLATVFTGIFTFGKNAVLVMAGERIIEKMRGEMFQKLKKFKAQIYTDNTGAVLSSYFINDVENINTIFTEGIASMIIDTFKIIGIIISVWMFAWQLGIFTLILLPLLYFPTKFYRRKMLEAQVNNLKELSKVNNHISESIQNSHMIKVFNKEYYMESLYAKRINDNFLTMDRVNFYDASYSPIIIITKAIVIVVIAVMASGKFAALGLSVGTAAASIDFIKNLFTPIEDLGMELQNLQKGISGMKRVNDFYNYEQEQEKDDSITAYDVLDSTNQNGIAFENVTFSYNNEKNVLNSINLNINIGENVTFAGRTGVGKSTLFKLVLGILKPTDGNIKINGINVYDIPNTQKRKIFGYVEQQFTFIKGTVAQQISLRDENITREQIEDVIKFIGLDEYVRSFKDGYDTNVESEQMFSQGQKQLLSIARAIVSDPKILLLDEVTANLDSVTEDRVVNVLKKAGENRTILSVSHRLASMMNCNRIIYLKDAKIEKIVSVD